MLADWRVYQHAGLKPIHPSEVWPENYRTRQLTDRAFDEPFPEGTVVHAVSIGSERAGESVFDVTNMVRAY